MILLTLCVVQTIAPKQAALPIATEVNIGSPLNYSASVSLVRPSGSIRYIPHESVLVKVGGKWFTIRKSSEYVNDIQDVQIGKDGSVYFVEFSGESIWTLRDYTYYHGRTEPLAGPAKMDDFNVAFYQDRKNYVGSCVESQGTIGYWGSPTLWYRTRNGRSEVMGYGDPVCELGRDRILTSVALNPEGRPAFFEDDKSFHLWLYTGQTPLTLGLATFMNKNSDASFWFWKEAGRGKRAVYHWQSGKVVSGFLVPARYKPLLAKKDGTVLLRVDRSPSEDDQWDIALVMKGTLHPVAFDLCNRAASPYWREGTKLHDGAVIQFDTFGERSRTVTLAPKR